VHEMGQALLLPEAGQHGVTPIMVPRTLLHLRRVVAYGAFVGLTFMARPRRGCLHDGSLAAYHRAGRHAAEVVNEENLESLPDFQTLVCSDVGSGHSPVVLQQVVAWRAHERQVSCLRS
jgi:hypothetical protein